MKDFKPLNWIEPYARIGAVRLPSGVAPYGDVDTLARQVRAFINRYFECDEVFESVAVLFVLHTWLYERFNAVPYLRFLGMSGTGKTRGSETIASLCYRPLVLGGSITPAALFRISECLGGTMFLDEADFESSQIGSDVAKILNDGYRKGIPVTRMQPTSNGDYIPRLYEIFGPKILNGRRPFKDDATESRCLSHTPRSLARNDIPRQLPESFEAEARAIRNMLLRWRFDMLNDFTPKEIHLEGLRPRTSEILMPLICMAVQLSEPRYMDHLLSFGSVVDLQAMEERKTTVEAILLQAYAKIGQHRDPTCKELATEAVSTGSHDDPKIGHWLSPKVAGKILRSMGFKTRHTNRGSVASVDAVTFAALGKRFGIVTGAAPWSLASGDRGEEEVIAA